ncbi:unnamed protein product [Cylindrotheca closterium]|uniref:Uncharacterized protein n=1 Tax=Cylindrotheca closterium TaxID=2856 RepID=A0AAD2PWZ7_9STRA|nr:unnamed protein product [Cylindrotheca closterium]
MFTLPSYGYGIDSAKDAVSQMIPRMRSGKPPSLHSSDEDETDSRREYYQDKGTGEAWYYNPCYPSGYRVRSSYQANKAPMTMSYYTNWGGTGSFKECQYAITHRDKTAKKIGYPYFWKELDGPDLNKIHGNRLWAFGIFYDIMSGVGEIATGEAAREFFIADFERVAKEICEKPWKEIDANYPEDTQPREYNSDLCFSALYAHSYLTFGLGFDPQQQITIGNKLENIDIHWTLGAVIQHVSEAN